MQEKKIRAIKDFILSAEKSIRNAKKLLKELLDENDIRDDNFDMDVSGLYNYSSGKTKIIEGVFTGEEMLGADGHIYPVPSNYASKSKLVQGDKMKLTIKEDGAMLYKQIQPIDRDTKVGLLSKDKSKFQVIVDDKSYNVLTAAVTHFKGEVGDSVSIIIPAGKEATFAAIETIIPKE